jgi:hypothetical protein
LPRLDGFKTFQTARHQREEIFEKNRFSAEHHKRDFAVG